MSEPAPTTPTAPAVLVEPAQFTAGLTVDQRQAVEHGYGPLLIFAGPGAGKTRTITHRIAYMLACGWAAPSQILAVTFTVAAAGEMRERLASMLGIDGIRGLTVATFHSVCAKLLRTHAGVFGRGDDYTIYDQADMAKVYGHVLSDKDRAAVQHHVAAVGDAPAKEILKEVSLAKNRLWFPDHYEQHSSHPLAPLIAQVWREAEDELRQSNAFDFDDLLIYAVRLLSEFPQLLAHYKQRWPWMLVDEFQDTNYAQMALVSLVAGPTGNLTVVADDDQLLYSFRGAEAGNVLGFGNWFPGFASVTLGRNYRCRSEILTAAASCVSHNQHRVPKALIADKGPGGRLETPVFGDDFQEAEWLAREISGALQGGLDPSEVLIVARTGFALRALEQTLLGYAIPYRKLGDLGLFERSEVKDALAYLALLVNPHDSQAFRRVAQGYIDGVGAQTANRIIAAARELPDGDLIGACQAPAIAASARGKAKQSLPAFAAEMKRLRGTLESGRSVGHVVLEALMVPGGPVRRHQQVRDNSEKSEDRREAEQTLEDLRSLARAASTYENQQDGDATLGGFLEHACGLNAAEVDAGQGRITLATIHRSKGKEAHTVVLIGAEERLLPSWRSLEDDTGGDLEEERRMFYVAVTRAKERLVITQAAQRGGRDTEGPSRFLAEAGL